MQVADLQDKVESLSRDLAASTRDYLQLRHACECALLPSQPAKLPLLTALQNHFRHVGPLATDQAMQSARLTS